MSEPVTFGDLLDQARHHLDAAGHIPGRPGNEHELLDATRGMHSVITVISQYFGDILTGYPKKPDRRRRVESRPPESVVQWTAAFLHARRAAVSAARYLEPATVLRSTSAFATERGRHLNTAALALVVGRDLLHMHTATRLDGKSEERSLWAPVISAPEFRQAVAAEIAALARQAAAVGSAFVAAPMIPWDQTTDPRKAMHNAGQCLRILHGAIQAARRQNPVEAADRDLIRAVPVRATPDRRLPDGTENITTLCDGVITAAERLRQSARLSAERNFRSPDLNVESLRRAAVASTAATHNCAIILAALAEAPVAAQPDETAAEMTQAIDSIKQARSAWLRVALALSQFTSDMPSRISAEAADAHDLALWTGRLAEVDSTWILSSNPNQEGQPALELAPTPDTRAIAVTAVHHATDSLRHLAAAHQQQAHIAARGGRFLVPTESQKPDYYIASRYAPAPPYRANSLVAAYKDVRMAGWQVAASVAPIAEMTNASSRTISRVSEIAREEDGRNGFKRKPSGGRQSAEYHSPDLPGPVERSLQSLRVTDPHQLRHAAAIDRAGEQLILDSCADQQSDRYSAGKMFRRPKGLWRTNAGRLAGAVADQAARPRVPYNEELEREP
jgi:hypothetical protein